jgi:hypothetical protein
MLEMPTARLETVTGGAALPSGLAASATKRLYRLWGASFMSPSGYRYPAADVALSGPQNLHNGRAQGLFSIDDGKFIEVRKWGAHVIDGVLGRIKTVPVSMTSR